MVDDSAQRHFRATSVLLALLPVASFAAQYLLSVRAGTEHKMFQHVTVTLVDWVFVPFNFVVASTIDWRRGGALYVIACISIALNVLAHAVWQSTGIDPGHMITPAGVMLPAGWVHLAYSCMQTTLLIAFVFCRHQNARSLRTATFLAATYFVVMGVSGYAMHGAFIPSDIVASVSGLVFVLVYPRFVPQAAA